MITSPFIDTDIVHLNVGGLVYIYSMKDYLILSRYDELLNKGVRHIEARKQAKEFANKFYP